jgi:hypothetical protein
MTNVMYLSIWNIIIPLSRAYPTEFEFSKIPWQKCIQVSKTEKLKAQPPAKEIFMKPSMQNEKMLKTHKSCQWSG